MKRSLVAAIFVLFLAAPDYAQLGLGLGSDGINIKSPTDKNLRIIGRANFSFSRFSRFTPEVNVVKQFVNEKRMKT